MPGYRKNVCTEFRPTSYYFDKFRLFAAGELRHAIYQFEDLFLAKLIVFNSSLYFQYNLR